MSIILKGIDLPTDRKPYGIEVIYRFEGADGLFSENNYLSPNEAIQIPKNHGRLIDANKLEAMMYHEAFEIDSDMQKWDSGCWIRYKVFENCMDRLLPDTIIEAEEK